jgi:DNA-binding Lrp family transcriptional regulator
MALPWHRKAFLDRYLLTVWPLKCDAQNRSDCAIVYPPASPQYLIDELDHDILKVKSVNPTISHSELSSALDRPVTEIDQRMEDLHTKRIINSCGFSIDWGRLGIALTEVSVTLNRIDAALIDALVEFGRASSTCHSVAGCLGTWDFQFNVLTESPDTLHRFTSDLWHRFGDFIESLHVTTFTRPLRVESYPFPNLATVLA